MFRLVVPQGERHAGLFDAIEHEPRSLAVATLLQVDAIHGVALSVAHPEPGPLARDAWIQVQHVAFAAQSQQ